MSFKEIIDKIQLDKSTKDKAENDAKIEKQRLVDLENKQNSQKRENGRNSIISECYKLIEFFEIDKMVNSLNTEMLQGKGKIDRRTGIYTYETKSTENGEYGPTTTYSNVEAVEDTIILSWGNNNEKSLEASVHRDLDGGYCMFDKKDSTGALTSHYFDIVGLIVSYKFDEKGNRCKFDKSIMEIKNDIKINLANKYLHPHDSANDVPTWAELSKNKEEKDAWRKKCYEKVNLDLNQFTIDTEIENVLETIGRQVFRVKNQVIGRLNNDAGSILNKSGINLYDAESECINDRELTRTIRMNKFIMEYSIDDKYSEVPHILVGVNRENVYDDGNEKTNYKEKKLPDLTKNEYNLMFVLGDKKLRINVLKNNNSYKIKSLDGNILLDNCDNKKMKQTYHDIMHVLFEYNGKNPPESKSFFEIIAPYTEKKVIPEDGVLKDLKIRINNKK